MKELFEKWIVKQMGEKVKPLLGGFDEEDGYIDEVINGMWIGFNAGYAIANTLV